MKAAALAVLAFASVWIAQCGALIGGVWIIKRAAETETETETETELSVM